MQRSVLRFEILPFFLADFRKYERCFVRSFGWYDDPQHLFIAMEYLELGDLFAYTESRPALLEDEAKEITYQILDGLSMMHENEFAHRDLKPSVSRTGATGDKLN
jgi:serine/threonine protein kinase